MKADRRKGHKASDPRMYREKKPRLDHRKDARLKVALKHVSTDKLDDLEDDPDLT